jgi:putative ABC transport system permease protein
VREVLVILQFALATAFIVGTLVLAAQTRHVRNADLGFARDGLMMIPTFPEDGLNESQRASLLAAFSEIPGVKAVGTSDTTPGDKRHQNHPNVKLPGMTGSGPAFLQITIGRGFFQVYRPALLAGRLLDDAHGGDDTVGKTKNDMQNIVISREGARVLGFTPAQAIGKNVKADDGPRTIIGVVEDMRFYSPREEKHATYYRYQSHYVEQPGEANFPIAAVRFDGDPRHIAEGLRSAWRRIAPEVPFKALTADQSLETYYKSDDQAGRLFAIGAGLAVAIGCVGLWGLASFNTQRRVREIGIRKTLGASSRDIVMLLVTQFLRPVMIANFIAWPLAFVAMRTWLAGFEDRIALSPLYFIGATLASLLIAVGTVIMQSLRAARAAPAWALRHE